MRLNKITTPENVVPVKSMPTEFRNRSEHKMDELPKSMATTSLSRFESGKKDDPVPMSLSNILQRTTSHPRAGSGVVGGIWVPQT